MQDQEYMRRAIELAKIGRGYTNPNPMVGAVIVKDGRIIGEGWHHKCGGLHAEREALASLTQSAAGAAIYVTLEPCCHHGRQPPCTEALLEAGISRVVIGSRDPNPLVAGRGAAQLRAAGVTVEEDFLREECDALNPIFFHYITTGLPYVTVKYAMTLDGKIASHTGASKWITGETARAHVHDLRGTYAAILAGVGTVLADDPMLNCRLPGAHQPVRIIADSHLRLPADSAVVRSARDYPTVIACAADNPDRRKILQDAGCEVLVLPGRDGRVDLAALMRELGRRELDSVLIEGGGILHEAALRAGIVSHVCAYAAPMLMGGAEAKTPVEGPGFDSPDSAVHLINRCITTLGEDILLEYDIKGADA